jgi:Mg/Co/Ni transporter MgtE
MDRERAADILEEMAPNAAADILEDLGDEVAEQLLSKMEPEEAADVQALMAYDEDSVGRVLTTDFVRVPASSTVGEALAHIRSLEEPPDPLLAVYVVGMVDPDDEAETIVTTKTPVSDQETGHTDDPEQMPFLQGIVRLRSLILADPQMPIAEAMETDLPTVHPEDQAEHAARVLAEYNLLAVPVLDDARHLIGIVTVDDALAVLLPEIWQRRGSRVFA